jgi:hypothetical protein
LFSTTVDSVELTHEKPVAVNNSGLIDDVHVCKNCGCENKNIALNVSNVNVLNFTGETQDIKSESTNSQVNVPCSLCCSLVDKHLFVHAGPTCSAKLDTAPCGEINSVLVENQPCVPLPLPAPRLSQMTLSLSNWEKFLVNDFDASYLLDGV